MAIVPAPLPGGAPVCDCHVHVYDPDYAYAPGAALQPPQALAADLVARNAELGIGRCIVVQPTSYGHDNRCALDAVARIGRDRARAVVAVPTDIDDEGLRALAQAGARGVRINAARGDVLDTDGVAALAGRLAPLGWHLLLHVGGQALPSLAPWLSGLPVPVVLDHMGRANPAQPPDSESWRCLQALLAQPRVWLKFSAPYLLSAEGPPDYGDLAPLLDRLLAVAPDRILWGSDWPHPGWQAQGGQLLDEASLCRWACDHLARRGLSQAVLADNPARLYGFS